MNATDPLTSVRGQLVQFNLSPKGVPEGLLVRRADGPEVQVNFDPELAGRITTVAKPGYDVELDVEPFADGHHDAHPVYALLRLTAAGRVVVADGPGEVDVTVLGTVVRLNHARRGEVNGAVLDTGDFVHLRPHGVRAIGGLRLGQTVDVRGDVRPGWSGTRVIEAVEANGIPIGGPPHKVHTPGPKHHGSPKRR